MISIVDKKIEKELPPRCKKCIYFRVSYEEDVYGERTHVREYCHHPQAPYNCNDCDIFIEAEESDTRKHSNSRHINKI